MTTMRIHDTLSRAKVDFHPLDPDHVRIYVCGPTVYDYAHIGNARPVVVFDVLVRLMRRLFPKVTYVRNITDIDDKINARALESGRDIREITEETAKVYHEDMLAVGALPPDVEPRATEHVAQMIDMIENLIAKGHAYEAEGHVVFSVPSMPDYGLLSKLDRREIIAGARVDVAPYKKDAQDFVLWKPSDGETPGWDSPWGRGRPGWHIECSAMSYEYLGDKFDIHGGGVDLVFPHHENEIAQSKCALGVDAFATYWMHNGYLMSEGEKMSKSLGNFYTVHELLEEFPGEAIRLLLLQTHYRQPLDFTKAGIAEARRTMDRWYRAADGVELNRPAAPAVIDALADDLNTPKAIAELHKLSSCDPAGLLASARLMGFLEKSAEDWFKWQPPNSEDMLDDMTIHELIKERVRARHNKDFTRSDQIRDDLAAKGIILEDGPAGTSWRRG